MPGGPLLRYTAARTLKRLSGDCERLPSPRGRRRSGNATMRALALLALLQATLAGVPVAVRNLVGRDVIVAWLQPGPEPRTRIPQQAKPLTNSSVMSIDSFATHEFIVYDAAAEQQSNIKKPDGHESCEFWASVGECAANPGYMLVTCANACDNLSKKKNNGEELRGHEDSEVPR